MSPDLARAVARRVLRGWYGLKVDSFGLPKTSQYLLFWGDKPDSVSTLFNIEELKFSSTVALCSIQSSRKGQYAFSEPHASRAASSLAVVDERVLYLDMSLTHYWFHAQKLDKKQYGLLLNDCLIILARKHRIECQREISQGLLHSSEAYLAIPMANQPVKDVKYKFSKWDAQMKSLKRTAGSRSVISEPAFSPSV
jgi:hypothetical protein